MSQTKSDDAPVAAAGPSAPPAATAAGADELLSARRPWFRSFPEGPLEFVAAVRMVWILALFVVPVVGGFLRTYGTVGVAALLLADLGLTMWWLTRLVTDRNCWLGGQPVGPTASRWAGLRPTLVAIVAQGLLVAFGLSFLALPFEAARNNPAAVTLVRWVLCASYMVAIPFVVATCRTVGLRGRWYTVLLAVPFVHWWAVRRFAADAGASLAEQVARQSKWNAGFSRAGFIFADATWVVLILVVIASAVTGGIWTRMTFQGLCSAMIMAVAAIADVAAMEAAQHAYVMYLRTATQPKRS